ncbi:MAG: tripartite tricarboxylate transporter TctB family protein [Alphaproteobacteria bacterium]|nr:tripartite tricarboxylate transporter TctB family protein [Alphaproteobacteria bacterium]
MTVRTAEILMAILMALLSIAFMMKSAELNIGWVKDRGPGAGAWPFWLATGMLICCLATIVRWFLRATPESRSTAIFIPSSALTMVVSTVAALAFLLLLTPWISIYLALMLFLVFYLKVMGGHGWGMTLAITIAMPVVVFCLFEWALTISLPKGVSFIEELLFYPLYDLIY